MSDYSTMHRVELEQLAERQGKRIEEFEKVVERAKEVEESWLYCCPTALTLEERELSRALKSLTAEEKWYEKDNH